jgi:hypothetical protein
MISILHATRGRAKMALETKDFWMKRASTEIEWLFGVDQDDTESLEVLTKAAPASVVINTGPKSNVAASNAAYRASHGDVICQCSDDYYCPREWDKTIMMWLNKFGGVKEPLVLGAGDTIGGPDHMAPYSGDGMLTMVCGTRVYFEQCGGFMLYPEYDGMVADLAFTAKAALDGALIDSYEQVRFFHDWHGMDPTSDKTYREHMTPEKSHQGHQAFSCQRLACMPDVKVHENVHLDLLDEQKAKGLIGPLAFEKGVPGLGACHGIDGNCLNTSIAWRRKNGGAHIENLPHKLEACRMFLAGDFEGARAAIEPVVRMKHKVICGGRFRFHVAHWIWNVCTQVLRDREPSYNIDSLI